MKSLPENAEYYQKTPEFTEETLPAGLRRAHHTKAGTWGRIVVLEGRLMYRICQEPMGEWMLDRDNPGVIEPEVQHEVEPLGRVRFYVEFYR